MGNALDMPNAGETGESLVALTMHAIDGHIRDSGMKLGQPIPSECVEALKLPVAPHDCAGPVVLAASTHLSLNAPNALMQESVRAYYKTWYRDVVSEVPSVKNGMITVPAGPGLGLELHPEIDTRFKTTRRLSMH